MTPLRCGRRPRHPAGPRLGVYFVPADGTPLARFGNAVLGRDADGRAVAPAPDLPFTSEERVARAARYGFHATLKAPFHLAAGRDEVGLRAACERLAAAHEPIPMPALAPHRLGTGSEGFAALVLPEPVPGVDALAADCVRLLEGWRAPLDAAALARRRPERLDPAARERLARWGYPHVLEGFRFHMTLSGPLDGSADTDGWIEALGRAYATRVGRRAVLDRIALCREERPGGRFVRVAEFPLGRVDGPR